MQLKKLEKKTGKRVDWSLWLTNQHFTNVKIYFCFSSNNLDLEKYS